MTGGESSTDAGALSRERASRVGASADLVGNHGESGDGATAGVDAKSQARASQTDDPWHPTNVWESLMLIREDEHLKAYPDLKRYRSLSFTDDRRRDLLNRLKEVRKNNFSLADFRAGYLWCYRSENIRAKGARSTREPLTVFLRKSKCIEYIELALQERESSGPVSTQKQPNNSPFGAFDEIRRRRGMDR